MSAMNDKDAIVHEAARLICEELITDYRQARHKAAQRLGVNPVALPSDGGRVEQAVLDYQRLFGGSAYSERLHLLRETALHAMQLLQAFEPRLVGAVVSGAVTAAHRVQLHAFCDKPEMLEIFLQDRGIRCEQSERTYRHAGGREERVPLACFEAGDVGVDVAMFDPEDLRRPPLNPADGQAYRRLDLAAASALASRGVQAAPQGQSAGGQSWG